MDPKFKTDVMLVDNDEGAGSGGCGAVDARSHIFGCYRDTSISTRVVSHMYTCGLTYVWVFRYLYRWNHNCLYVFSQTDGWIARGIDRWVARPTVRGNVDVGPLAQFCVNAHVC